MKEVVKTSNAQLADILQRQATQYAGEYELGLGRIKQLLDRLGRPQDRIPPVFHVAGTNGKGSVCAFLRAGLEAAGYKVHAFTSPHLVRYNERIRLAGRLIDDDQLVDTMSRVLDCNGGIGGSLFEINAAAALLAFAEVPADACILEVGLGGRLDATNVIDHPLITGIANLAIDHQQFLGDRLPGIAAEKAGIARANVPLVTQLYPPAVASRIAQVSNDVGALWMPRGRTWDAIVRQGRLHYRDKEGELDLPLPRLPGRHQAMNAALAIAMLRHQSKLPVPAPALGAAMGWADWPARLQHLAPGPLVGDRDVWLDGGHNPSAARQIASYVKHHFDDGRALHLVFASLATKDPPRMLEPFIGLVARVHTVPVPSHASFAPNELADIAGELGFAAEAHDSVEEALAAIPAGARILIFGSLYLAGDVLTANDQIPD